MDATGSTWCWVDGALQTLDAATVSVRDHGFVVGDGVFESVRLDHGVPFALTRHLERLERSAAGLGLPALDLSAVRRATDQVLEANLAVLRTGHDVLRIIATGGPGSLGSGRVEGGGRTLVLGVVPGRDPDPTTRVVTVPWVRNERGALSGLKTTSYGENVMALAAAHAAGAGEALFANSQGQLCEGSGTNVFVVVGGELLTPPLSSGCLAGVTRALVLEWHGGQEVDLPFEVLREADEVFLTSSGRDVQAVVAVDDHAVGSGAPGRVTSAAAATFARRQREHLDP